MNKVISALFLTVSLFLVVTAIQFMTPVAGDFEYVYRSVTLSLIQGRTNLYDSQSVGFYNAPWLLGLWIPFAWMPVAQWVNTLMIVCSILLSIYLLKPSQANMLFSVFNIPVFVLVVCGQVDGLLLLGVVLGYLAIQRKNKSLLSASLFILSTKPVGFIPLIVWFIISIRDWKPIALLVLFAIFCLPLLGADYPIRYVISMMSNPPIDSVRIELWRTCPTLIILIALVFLHCISNTPSLELSFALVLTLGILISPYVLWSHQVSLIPGLAILSRYNKRLALIAYLFSWAIPLFGMIYPIAIFVSLYLVVIHKNSAVQQIVPASESHHCI